MEQTVNAWMLVEMLGKEDHAINEQVFFREKDAQKEKVRWEAEWDVWKDIVPCTITYQLPQGESVEGV